ncbi:hypothetical protein [Streptomyces sp. MS2.AVA.5]|uniref:Uncharacterized protein n=1 Tax=Streptomyces achmelvichensis TaxID=3134111 RepID=A0ACC6Q9G0_9ACTN
MDLIEAGWPIRQIAHDRGMSEQTIHVSRRQHLIDTGRLPRATSEDQAALVAARRKTAEVKAELAIRRPCSAADRQGGATRRRYEAVAVMADEGMSADGDESARRRRVRLLRLPLAPALPHA